tara:strand:- start:146532 stop:146735 length:204 start_codon:yes stop_codon:yes gene_type:complete
LSGQAETFGARKDMARWKSILISAACLMALGGCHNDPFSIKPETNATLPKKVPPEPSAEPDNEEAPR